MGRRSSGKRYAQAAFKLALERDELKSWQKDLEKIAELTKNEELMALLQNPRLPFDVKKTLLQKPLAEINPLAFNLALLLVTQGLLRMGQQIFQQYVLLLDVHQGIERAQVTTALTLGDDEREAISRRLGDMAHRKVVIDGQIDPSIIGGFIARMGDQLIDGSIRQKLETLKKSLTEAGR
jgi:F-type H+-transporting ATPase subunit delta